MGERQVDQELVERVQRGDKKAFDLLVLKYQRKVVNLVSRYVRNQSEALDVTQEAFIKAYKALPNFRGDSAFYTWIYRIAINTAKNHIVAQGRRPPGSDLDAGTAEQMDIGIRLQENTTPENQLLQDEIAETVRDAIEDLPEDLRSSYIAQVPMKRFGKPDEVAACVMFLASKEASYVNGATLEVTGGL